MSNQTTFGSNSSNSKPVPDRIFIDRTDKQRKELPPLDITPRETKAEQQRDRLPVPTGYRLLVVPYRMPETSKGGIVLAESTKYKEELAGVVGYVISMGPDAYGDVAKFPNGPWCKVGDYILFGRYAGAKISMHAEDEQDDLPLRILNDDEIIATINHPEDYVGVS